MIILVGFLQYLVIYVQLATKLGEERNQLFVISAILLFGCLLNPCLLNSIRIFS
jgi:hypothetical protein